jgi:type IV secretory pathway component VirB8
MGGLFGQDRSGEKFVERKPVNPFIDPSTHRALKLGETINEGDEYWDADRTEWKATTSIGNAHHESRFIYRRMLATTRRHIVHAYTVAPPSNVGELAPIPVWTPEKETQAADLLNTAHATLLASITKENAETYFKAREAYDWLIFNRLKADAINQYARDCETFRQARLKYLEAMKPQNPYLKPDRHPKG